MKVVPSFSAVCLDLQPIPLIVRHNLVMSVMGSMLSTNSLPMSFLGDLIIQCRQPGRGGVLLALVVSLLHHGQDLCWDFMCV